ncbi:tetratricopeptide repeat protein [Thalassotalea sp. ND16A]|uniref:tetratricopeptide repeat protein n=1 Tax=Thalassotalea sp. ND16A TaxID=1535422 RepID=UPI00051D3373|nr:tetratricopeptide repeat protein [Thalassotalea sp. ND16A]KGJ97142.1 hypothetical protein ND16A_0064 [Thalassotalea sp. ND16A]
MMNHKLLALSISALLSTTLLNGCSLVEQEPAPARQRSATLASLELKPSAEVKMELPSLSLRELNTAYKELLNSVNDPVIRAQVQQRIAVLDVLQGEQAQMYGSIEDNDYYRDAIVTLESFIEQNPQGEGSDKLLYQLAKAYDLQGEQDKSLVVIERLITEHPNNEFMLEVQFRRAEILFSKQRYVAALTSYDYVINHNVADDENVARALNPYYNIASYMRGWSYFKVEQHQQALNSFSAILDKLIPYKLMATSNSQAELLSQLNRKDHQLVSETLKIMTLIFSSNENDYDGQAISRHYQQLGQRPYEYLNYQLLAEFYLTKQRYSDAVAVYNQFVSVYPNHQVAPLASISKMAVLEQGGFPGELAEEKQRFVEHYQFDHDYWQQVNPRAKNHTKAQVTPVLVNILRELSQDAHANAQQQRRLLASGEHTVSKTEQKALVKAAYSDTAHWYQTFLANFPRTIAASNIKFYLAESFYETGQYLKAAEFYQQVAYDQVTAVNDTAAIAGAASQKAGIGANENVSQNKESTVSRAAKLNDAPAPVIDESDIELVDYRSEAAYALILLYDKLLSAETNQAKKADLLLAQLDVKARFVATFPGDLRTSTVQQDLFQQYFKAGEHKHAIDYAKQTLNSNSELTAEQKLSALLVIAHSEFYQQDYPAAELSYQRVLANLATTDNRYADMQDRLAATIYRQGEIAANAEPADLALAVTQFARVLSKTPDSKIRLNAQYDMATHLLTLGRYQQAIEQLLDFKQRYPEHTLSNTIAPKLAYAYQQSEQWQQAAAYLKMSWAVQPKSAETRQFLWLAAQTYLKAGNKAEALDAYRTYAHTYAAPFATLVEAQFMMSEFYRKGSEHSISSNGEPRKYKFWLRKMIDSDRNADEQRSERSRYLAAQASLFFADETMSNFKRRKLTLPLNKSLSKKRDLLEQTLTAYNKTVKYQVAEFTTVANYRIGEVYSQLSKDLMASERPDNLNELELEQYDILLEEQSFPFEDKAIAVHEANARRSVDGTYDQWVQKSFRDLAQLLPGRYNKVEQIVEVVNEIY